MKRYPYIVLIVFATVALDQFTKYLIVTRLSPFESIELSSFFHIVNVRNTGAAFGSFRNMGSTFFIIVSLIAMIFIVSLLIQRTYSTSGLSLVLGGAIGNLIDRIVYGNVVDFADFSVGTFHWPAFNVADSALTVGIFIIIVTSFLKK